MEGLVDKASSKCGNLSDLLALWGNGLDTMSIIDDEWI
jgi:hypothetical protein